MSLLIFACVTFTFHFLSSCFFSSVFIDPLTSICLSLSVHSDICVSVCKLWPLISDLKRGTWEVLHSFEYRAVHLYNDVTINGARHSCFCIHLNGQDNFYVMIIIINLQFENVLNYSGQTWTPTHYRSKQPPQLQSLTAGRWGGTNIPQTPF